MPLFPLHAVLFPGGRLPLRVFEQRYLEMAKDCLRREAPFGVCLILEGREVGEPAVPAPVGTLAKIDQWDMPQLGMLNIVALGGRRFRVLERRVQSDGLARGRVELLPEEEDSPARAEFLRLAEVLPLPLDLKQELLELGDARERLSRLAALLKPG